jgi:DUF971 family protein
MSHPIPTAIRRRDDGAVEITWSDGAAGAATPRQLRDACPCASCREQRVEPAAGAGLLPVLSPEDLAPLAIAGMSPVGQYAYKISFSDGHDSGIYPLDYLRELTVHVRSTNHGPA